MDDLFDDEGALPRGSPFVHVLGGLDPVKHQVSNVEGAFRDIVIVVALYLLLMTCMLHEGCHMMLFKAVNIDLPTLFCLALVVVLDTQGAKGHIRCHDGLGAV